MFTSKIATITTAVSAVKGAIRAFSARRGIAGTTAYLSVIALLLSASGVSVQGAVNVSPATPQLQSDFVAATTSQWLGTLTASPYFAGTYSFNLTGPNPAYKPPVPVQPPVFFDSGTFVSLMAQAVKISSDTYAYGWANGMDYERQHELIAMTGFYTMCSDSTTFKVPNISSMTCLGVIGTISNFIYQMNFSTPVATMGF